MFRRTHIKLKVNRDLKCAVEEQEGFVIGNKKPLIVTLGKVFKEVYILKDILGIYIKIKKTTNEKNNWKVLSMSE